MTFSTPSRSLLLAALALLPCLTSCSEGGGQERKNVILVTLDTTRPDFFGSWGAEGDLTPRLDELAAEGARFSMAVSASAVTPVSHASILTGRTPYGHGLRVLTAKSGFSLPGDVPTLATQLKRRGYATAAVHSAFPVSRIFGLDRSFDVYEDMSNVKLEDKQDGGQGWNVLEGQRRSDKTTDMVLDFLASTSEPFFLWIHYWDPHDMGLLPDPEFLTGDRRVTAEPNTMAYWRQIYGLEISYVDSEFGRVLDALRESGRYDQTLIAVIADHGEGLDDGQERHGWAAHRILYQEQIHVPLIVRIPGGPSGVVVDDLVRSIDVFPTLLDYLDVAPEGEVDGRSLRPLMEGGSDAPRVAYADQINLWDTNAKMVEKRPQAAFLHMAMDARYKLIYRPSHPEDSELYDYRADPLELEDLFHEPLHRDARVRLLEDLAEREGWVLVPFTEGEGMTAADREKLAKLGYTEGAEAGEVPWDWICPRDWSRTAQEGPCPTCGRRRLPAKRAAQD